ncbi:Piso0_004924 [Millerozyma farinosa CBS 7064]|uniref:Piso0_004924 protein n=1 Tax=Pichia sorbitophila (strain ATCC MYA-4447 / BCRC 22081 / CBS 7064 / NBRC 10061 / NRRL Y-12695) TaxID=559304 RepID=G8Y3R8_PICSO|nr:Piso0_004924 [Millerozyma farinosa CBS 7064]
MLPSKKRFSYGAAGACLGVSVYQRLEFQGSSGYVKPLTINIMPTKPISILQEYLQLYSKGGWDFQLINAALLFIFVTANFMKLIIVGQLRLREIQILKNQISYTIWEFFFGFGIFLYNAYQEELAGVRGVLLGFESVKFFGLFSCVMLLKCFHYLCAERMASLDVPCSEELEFTPKRQHLRLSTGLAMLYLIDILLIHRFFYEVRNNYSNESILTLKDNILVSIFGFEILHIFPMIILTSGKLLLRYMEFLIIQSIELHGVDDRKLLKWHYIKLKVDYVLEFVVNFLRFSMTCVFSVLFLYYYTFPLHILPSSFLTLRLAIVKARHLLSFRKRGLKLQKLSIPETIGQDEKCIICYEKFEREGEPGVSNDVRLVKGCGHIFHLICLKNWFSYSSVCPVCRRKV